MRTEDERFKKGLGAIINMVGEKQFEIEAKDTTIKMYENEIQTINENTKYLLDKLDRIQNENRSRAIEEIDNGKVVKVQADMIAKKNKECNNLLDGSKKQLEKIQRLEKQIRTLKKKK